MEPLSALSLACNVLQLVEQSIEATRTCKQIYERGSLESNDNIEDLTKEVVSANQDVSTALSSSQSVRNTRRRKLAQEANSTAQELHRVLNNIKYAKSQGSSNARVFKQTIRTLVKRGTIGRLEVRLKDQETFLRSGLLKAVYLTCNEAEIRQTAAFNKLHLGQQSIIVKYLDGNSKLFNEIVSETKASEARIFASHAAQTAQLHKAIQNAESITSAQITAAETNLKAAIEGSRLQTATKHTKQRLLDYLRFDGMNQRQDMIENRVDDFSNSFQWLFDPEEPHGFVDWLNIGTGIFWISGRAASGK